MIIVVDIDQCLTDTADAVLQYLRRKHKVDISKYDYSSYSIADSFPEYKDEITNLFNNQDFIISLKPKFLAAPILWGWSQTNTLHCITSRPESVAMATYEWLDSNFSQSFMGLHFVENSVGGKEAFASMVGAEVCIEDHPLVLQEYKEAEIKTIAVGYKYNEHVLTDYRVNGMNDKVWEELDKLAMKIGIGDNTNREETLANI